MKGGASTLAAIVVLVAVLPPLPMGGAAPPYAAHAPISITSDLGFTAANGVVSGTGSVADPYVIAGWDVYATIGHAILVTNVTKSFVIRDNRLDATSSGVYVSLSSGVAVVTGNEFVVRQTGVTVVGANVDIHHNAFSRTTSGGVGVRVTSSGSVIADNTFNFIQTAIVGTGGTPTIVRNDIHASVTGISLTLTTNALVDANVVTDTTTGIDVRSTTRTRISGNFVTTTMVGMEIWIDKDVDIDDNEVRYAMSVGVRIESSSGNFTANVVADGSLDGVLLWHSPMLVASNEITNNLGVGLHGSMSDADVDANIVTQNGVGIRMSGESILRLTSNVLVDNTVGLDVPYSSRQAIPHMSGNLVNGVAVDAGASRVYHYQDANVLISGQTRDSGFGAGYYGSLTAQGNVVLYEVDTATIDSTTISHANVGVTSINSFNVVIEGSTILNTQTGVLAQAVTVPFQVPACAVSVKSTTINVTIDPPLTIGVDARACLVNVLGSTIGNLDTGIRIDGASWGNVSGNLVLANNVGLDVAGKKGEVSVVGNVLVRNRVGARFTSSLATVLDNHVEANVVAGVHLDAASRLAFAGNDVIANGEGVVDLRSCAGSPLGGVCSGIDATANVFADNRGDGVRVNATSTFAGDVFVRNARNGLRAGSATLVRVAASANGEDGASIAGSLNVRSSNFSANVRHGFRFEGGGEIRSSNFTWNGEAGIRASATYAIAIDVNASFNQDGILFDEYVPVPPVPTVQIPSISVPDLTQAVWGLVPRNDPMDIHRSVLIQNSRDAIRAGVAVVNATHNWFGGPPRVSVADTVGAYQNGVSPIVRFAPWYEDRAMTVTGPVGGL